MASFRVCELPQGSNRYRGVQRLGPYPPADEESVLYSECIKYIQNGDQFEELEDAIRLWNALGELQPNYELIRVTSHAAESCSNGILLGFDVVDSGGWNSLLCWDWNESLRVAECEPTAVLRSLIFSHFISKLNMHQLFASREDAEQFAQAVNALNSLAPGAFEGEEAGRYCIREVRAP